MFISVQAQLESYMVILCTLSVACFLRPRKVLEQGLIYVLGDAMNLARPTDDPTCVVVGGLILFQVFLIYLFALFKTDMMFFKDLTPFRTMLDFVLVLWIYFSTDPAISNGLTFTFVFFDLIWQFWMFVSFRGYKLPTKT
ncbi:hypothetical protein PORY_002774 [Pneumocystis oryctolagi]|uniref:Uncharacterized protein n=1 Tax=Pneumocystis oryctolagi TaxID=42067 RepID=A0ACB7C858_9ASCO|nr:hypothetical protein PORY_002774 [Pneumocystis oryctolagi]